MHIAHSWMSQKYQTNWVSVIVSGFNQANELQATLSSVQAQTWRPLEVVVIDDGSDDNTADVVSLFTQQHGADDLQVRYIKQEHSGESIARNNGLVQASGEYIQFLEAGDIIHPEKISHQVAAMRRTQVDFVWSAKQEDSVATRWGVQAYSGEDLVSAAPEDAIIAFVNGSQWQIGSGLYRRDLCIKVGPFRSVHAFSDWEYHVRMLATRPALHFLPGDYAVLSLASDADNWMDGALVADAAQALEHVIDETQEICGFSGDWHTAIGTRFETMIDVAKETGYAHFAHEITAQYFVFKATDMGKSCEIANADSAISCAI